MSSIELCVVIPVYNEEECIEKVISEWINEIRKLGCSFKLLVLNDGSKDSTQLKIQDLSKRYAEIEIVEKQNTGHGPTIYKGYEMALNLSPEWIFQVDSDDQFCANELIKLWVNRDRSDFIFGYRKGRKDPLHRKIMSFVLKVLMALFFMRWYNDPNVPFRLIKAEKLLDALNKIPNNAFAPNILLSVILDRQIPILWLPVQHKIRETGKVSFAGRRLLTGAWNSLKMIVVLRLKL